MTASVAAKPITRPRMSFPCGVRLGPADVDAPAMAVEVAPAAPVVLELLVAVMLEVEVGLAPGDDDSDESGSVDVVGDPDVNVSASLRVVVDTVADESVLDKVVGKMVPKMDEAIPEILSSAAICTPLQNAARLETWSLLVRSHTYTTGFVAAADG